MPDRVSSLQQDLAERLLAMAGGAVPPAVRARARATTLDVVSCMVAGAGTPWADAMRSVAAEGDITVIGGARDATLADAVCANATAAVALLRDEVHLPSASHLGAIAVPVALALAQARGLDGERVLRAIIAGYQAGGSIGAALLDPEIAQSFRPTGLIGAITAAATAGIAIDLDGNRLAAAIGLAANCAAGFNEWALGGGSEIYVQTGFAARAGLVAALLAERGMVASPHALEGPAGLFAAFGRRDAARQVMAVPVRNEILETIHKPFAACGAVQPVCQSLAGVRAVWPPTTAIAGLEVIVSPFAAAYPGCSHNGPVVSLLQAKQSIPFCAAAMLVHGALEPAFADLSGAEVRRLAAATIVTGDPSLAARGGAWVAAIDRTGRQHDAACEALEPIAPAALEQRFVDDAAMLFGPAAAAQLARRCGAIDQERDVAGLLRELRG